MRSLGSARSFFRASPVFCPNGLFNKSVRHYTKHEYEGKGFRRLLGPFWVLTTPSFLQSYAVITTFFLIFLYPLDSKLYNVRSLKADLDSKVGS
ncbi:hypothetical protein X943_003167 [Babesia divergens]|uniref:Uncharacterized protein n=1 Tax=Babesia divergens TaxID=32595 RepID=A0AAD9LLX2_BABDI|nr:hypothetical protein X943_003167 [Babesia divergens]